MDQKMVLLTATDATDSEAIGAVLFFGSLWVFVIVAAVVVFARDLWIIWRRKRQGEREARDG